MTDDEYEDSYREALLCLAETVSIGKPFVDHGGKRVCFVDGVPLDDDQVLERWWGKELAEEMRLPMSGKVDS
jgi:hypothetical protein